MLLVVSFGGKSCIIKWMSFSMIPAANKLTKRFGAEDNLLETSYVSVDLSYGFFEQTFTLNVSIFGVQNVVGSYA